MGRARAREPEHRARLRRERTWLVVAVVAGAAVFAADVLTGHHVHFAGYLFAVPFVAAVAARPRLTAVAGAYAVVLALVLGWPDRFFGSADHLLRVGVVVLGATMAVGLAVARTRESLARRRYMLLAETGRIAESTQDPELTLIQAAQLLSTRLADWCFVTAPGPDGELRPVAVMHRDPECQTHAWELLARYPVDARSAEGAASVIRESESLLVARVDTRDLSRWAEDDEHLRLLERLEIRSLMTVPLTARGRTLGALSLASSDRGQEFGADDLRLAEEIADRLAAAVENARLHNELSRAEAGLRGSRDELRAILRGVPDAITVQRPDGALVYANDAAVRATGFETVEEMMAVPAGEIAGRFELLDEDGQPVPTERLPGRRALAGDPDPEPILVRFRSREDPAVRWTRVKSTPIFDDEGRTVLAVNVIEDLTELQQANEIQRFLARASAILASSLDYETTLGNVARLAVPQLADWCAVDVLDEDGDIRHVVVAHTDPEKVDLAVELQRRYPVDPSSEAGVPNVVRTGRPEMYAEITDEMLVAGAIDEEHLDILRTVGMRSAMVVPMEARGRMLGALSFISSESGRRFGDNDFVFARELAGRCALAVDNARLFGERAHIARTLQESLLPPELPQPPGLEVAARFRAAGQGFDVGGDFYDVFDTGSSGWAAVIGDVCGKGPEAAAVTALARYTLRAAAMSERDPSRILATLNEAMLRQGGDRRFCTVLYARLDQTAGGIQLCFSSGGHPLPLIVRANGEVEESGGPGTLLGIVSDPDLFDQPVDLQPGDAAILYTDGVTDAAAPDVVREPLELARRMNASGAESADELAQRLLDAALGDEQLLEPRDDIAIVVIKARSGSAVSREDDARTLASGTL